MYFGEKLNPQIPSFLFFSLKVDYLKLNQIHLGSKICRFYSLVSSVLSSNDFIDFLVVSLKTNNQLDYLFNQNSIQKSLGITLPLLYI